MQLLKNIIILLVPVLILACNNKPKQIQAMDHNSELSNENTTGIFGHGDMTKTTEQAEAKSDVHLVTVEEVLPTEKYVYLNVTEEDERYWIAAPKQEVKEGEVYFYRGGLLKTNFESKEYNRIFDKVYLVSNIVPASHGSNAENNSTAVTADKSSEAKPKDYSREGSTKISELVNNPDKFDGKSIQLTGECTKINTNIMGKNWIHLKDGSQDDYDLVITSELAVPVGHVVTLSGTVVLNKDFGAGYQYEILVENGELVK